MTRSLWYGLVGGLRDWTQGGVLLNTNSIFSPLFVAKGLLWKAANLTTGLPMLQRDSFEPMSVAFI